VYDRKETDGTWGELIDASRDKYKRDTFCLSRTSEPPKSFSQPQQQLLSCLNLIQHRTGSILTMKFLTALGGILLGLSTTLVSGTPLQAEPLDFSPAPALEKKQACTNGPTSRNCWSPGFDATTDMYTSWPTGRTVSYDLSITNTTCNPDGQQSRVCMLINNQYPGPTIVANWGEFGPRPYCM